MTDDEALTILGHLIGTTTGWNDESVARYVVELARLDNAEALRRACRTLAATWEEARRPPLATITNLYHREAMRLEAPALPGRTRVIPPRQGVEVARDAYVAERRRLGLPVNMDRFDAMISAVTRHVAST